MFYDFCAPHALISLFDMIIKLKGQEVAYVYGYLANAYGISTNEPITRPLGPDAVLLTDALNQVEQVCKTLELPVTLDYVPIVRRDLQQAKTYGDVQNSIGQLRERMHSELKARLFLFVPPIEASYYSLTEPFGPEVAKKFSAASADIENAGNCIAVGLSTPAVFCLMRVMERGVQRLGKKLGVSVVGEKNWQTILNQLDKAVKLLPSKTPAEKRRTQNFAAASAHLYHVKLAWRNPVMHPKESYSPEQAVEIYGLVKTFMGHLTSIL
jgi:hypothetical protein